MSAELEQPVVRGEAPQAAVEKMAPPGALGGAGLVGLGLVGLGAAWAAMQLPQWPDLTGPGFFPFLAALGLAAIAFAGAIASRTPGGTVEWRPLVQDMPEGREGLQTLMVFVALCLGYVEGFGRIGYRASTLLFLLMLFLYLRAGAWWKSLVVALAVTLGVWWLFFRVFRVMLP